MFGEKKTSERYNAHWRDIRIPHWLTPFIPYCIMPVRLTSGRMHCLPFRWTGSRIQSSQNPFGQIGPSSSQIFLNNKLFRSSEYWRLTVSSSTLDQPWNPICTVSQQRSYLWSLAEAMNPITSDESTRNRLPCHYHSMQSHTTVSDRLPTSTGCSRSTKRSQKRYQDHLELSFCKLTHTSFHLLW